MRIGSLEKRQRALELAISERTAALQAEIGVRKEAEAALQKSNEDLSALNRMAQTLTEWADLSKAMQGVGVELSSLLGGASVGIWALDEQRRVLTCLLAVGHGQIVTQNHKVLLDDDSVSAEILDRLQLEVLDPTAHLPLIAGPPNLDVDEQSGEAMCVPLQSGGKAVGMMCIRATTQGEALSNEQTVLAQTIAGTLANAIENARLVAAERAAVAEEERANIARELHELGKPVPVRREPYGRGASQLVGGESGEGARGVISSSAIHSGRDGADAHLAGGIATHGAHQYLSRRSA